MQALKLRWQHLDARYFQIIVLSTLLTLNFVWIDFGAKPLYSALAIASALGPQLVGSRLLGLPRTDLRSALISGLSLSLLLRADSPRLPALAGVLAIASKLALRVDGKHVFNPAGLPLSFCCLLPRTSGFHPGNGAQASILHRC